MLTIGIVVSVLICFGQKKLNHINLKNIQLEILNPSQIKDVEAYQKEKFKNSRGKPTSVELVSNDVSKSYKLKGTDDLVMVTSLTYPGALENLENDVKTNMETFTPISSTELERYTEYINGKDFKAVIFFIKGYKLNNINYISYKNLKEGIVLSIRYISNAPDAVKIVNMRKIIKDMTFE
jgi:hypothetical protein